MAEDVGKESPQKDDSEKKEEEISLEDIDAILANDKEFQESLKEIQPETDNTKKDNKKNTDTETLNDEDHKPPRFYSKVIDKIKNSPIRLLFKIFKVILSPAQFVISKIKKTVKLIINSIKEKFKSLIQYFKKDFVNDIKEKMQISKDYIHYLLSIVKSMSGFKKILVVILIVLIGASIKVVKMNFKGQWIPDLNSGLLTSMELVADQVYSYSNKELIHFYSSFPQPEHTVLLKNIVVNLTREASSRHPMASIEMFIKLDSKDTAIEARERESELVDLIQREIEEQTYSQMNNTLELEKLKEHLKEVLNQYLNGGRAERVYFKLLISQP